MHKIKKYKQVSQYDKILQENIDAALPILIEKVLNIHPISTEELPDSLQYTKERKPDVLKKIVDEKNDVFVLHIEFQTMNDPNMPYRMGEYLIMLARKYKLPVQQYVIYIGEAKMTMVNNLVLGRSNFFYELISISAIDYNIFLNSKKPEERMLAILGDFGNDSPKTAILKIAAGFLNDANGQLERSKWKNQFRILGQLRTLVSQNIEIMEQVESFFKEENDIFYNIGEKKGAEDKSYQVVKRMLLAKKFTIDEIAELADVNKEFVQKVKKSL